METVAQWIKNPHSGNTWFHGLDVLGHILRADPEAVSKPRSPESSDQSYLSELRAEIEQYKRDTRLDELCADVFSRPRKRTRHIIAEDGDDVYVDGYVGGNRREYFTRARREEARHKPALSICFEGNVPHDDRGADYIEKYQLDAYDLIIKAEREGRPCRCVVLMEQGYSDRDDGHYRFHLVVKDWNEPVFPALWGCFKNNKTANTLANTMTAFIVGGNPWGNGTPKRFTLDSLPDGEEVVVVGHKNKRFMTPGPNAVLYDRKTA